jgi:Kef-type K+ transport system membrane component KefB
MHPTRPTRPMRSIASLVALAVIMAVLHRWTARAPLEARATLALGFLLVAAFVGGDLALRARLPRIMGYVLVGFAVGPAWLGLVRREEVDALQFLEDATVGLIALAAGLEVKLAALRQSRVAVARVAAGAMTFPFVAVTLVMVSVSPWFPLTVHHRLGDGVAVALVLGTWAAASSPVVTRAMFDELDVTGRESAPVASSLLGVTVVQDVVVVMLFALVLAGGKALTSPGALNLAVAGAAVIGLAGSLASGALVGFALSRYARLVPRDTASLLVATAFVAAAAARLAHLEPVLVGLAAGFSVENVAPAEAEHVRSELQRAATFVYATFFVLAGAGLRLGAVADLWPWMLLLVGLRVVSVRYGLRWAGLHGDVTPAVARDGWLGLISQGGTVVALGQLARRAFPEWGVSLEALLLAMIGIHLLAGPVCFRAALGRVGPTTGGIV